MNEYKQLMDLEAFFVGKIHGAFSWFDMLALKSGWNRLKAGETYVEIGVQYGRSTYVAFTLLPPGVNIYAVDILDWQGGADTLSRKEFFKETGMDSTITYINKPSEEVASNWKDGPIDMIFIDADHSYEGVKTDVESWAPHLKVGGYIYFHDADSGAVEKYVHELAANGEWEDFTKYKETLEKNTSVVSLKKK